MPWWNAKNKDKRKNPFKGKKRSAKTRRLMSIAKVGDKNPTKRWDVRAKMSATNVAKLTPEQHVRRLVKAKLRILKRHDREAYNREVSRRISEGKKRSWTDPEVRERTIASLQSGWDRDYKWRSKINKSLVVRRKLSKAMKGRGPIGRPRGPRKHLYDGVHGKIWMRSSEEVLYANWLDSKQIEWLYEAFCFVVGNQSWTPDFYLTKSRRFVEIKGWMPKDVKKKLHKVMSHYTSTKFEILHSSLLHTKRFRT